MQSDLEATLAHLVSIPSVSNNPAACQEILSYIKSEIEQHTLFISGDTDRESPWLIATTQDTKEPDILFAAHLDVVPADAAMFTMKKEDGKLLGRGVYDMKLAATSYLHFIRQHSKTLSQLNVGFLFTTDEEVGGFSTLAMLEMGWRPKLVFIPDGGDNWQIEELAKGLYGIELIARGKTAHGSRPWEGDNALHRILDVTTELRQLFPHQQPDDATLSVTQLTGGAAINQIADYASAKVDFRSFHKEDLALFYAELTQLTEKYGLEFTITQGGAPHIFDKSTDTAKRFLALLENTTGKPVEYTRSYGGSDARHFAEYDIPCIVIEPFGGGRHSDHEWLLASDLPRYYSLIETWALQQKFSAMSNHASAFHRQPSLS
jgi:succinyl-diaminopimelate desuccinylase